jgi:hypothetical protein
VKIRFLQLNNSAGRNSESFLSLTLGSQPCCAVLFFETFDAFVQTCRKDNSFYGWDTQNGAPNFVLFFLTEHYKFAEKKMSKSGATREAQNTGFGVG